MTQLGKYCQSLELLYCSLAQSSRALPKDTATAHGKLKASVSTTRSGFRWKGRRFAPVLIKHPGLLFDLFCFTEEKLDSAHSRMTNQSGRGVETRDPEVCERSEWALFTVSLKALQDKKKKKKKLLFRARCRQNVKLPEALLHGIILGFFLWWNGNGKQWKHE